MLSASTISYVFQCVAYRMHTQSRRNIIFWFTHRNSSFPAGSTPPTACASRNWKRWVLLDSIKKQPRLFPEDELPRDTTSIHPHLAAQTSVGTPIPRRCNRRTCHVLTAIFLMIHLPLGHASQKPSSSSHPAPRLTIREFSVAFLNVYSLRR